jgi:hypothetical protein
MLEYEFGSKKCNAAQALPTYVGRLQGDQNSIWKIPQNGAQSIFGQN